jgi:anaerobic selenocysteine-containing dehydrogenase
MQGYSEVHMILRFGGAGGSGICINDCNGYARAIKSPKIECHVILAPYLESEVLFSDIVLPASLELERNDIMGCIQVGRTAHYSPKIIEPPGEAKTDYEMLTGVAERLGFKDKYTDGNSDDDWMRKMYERSSVPERGKLTWEQFKAKGYYAYEFPKDYKPAVGMRWYYEKPEGSGFETPSGKIEFQSKQITDFWGEHSTAVGDVPKYFVSAYGRYSPNARRYPLQVVAQHNKYRIHTKWNSAPHLTDVYKLKNGEPESIKGIGYEPVWINPVDAEARGIKENDIVRIFNDTGQILNYAHVTDRIMPGVVWVPWGSWYLPLQPGNPDSPDAGGEYNTLAPRSVGGLEEYVDANGNIAFQRPHCLATHGHCILAQMEKWTG